MIKEITTVVLMLVGLFIVAYVIVYPILINYNTLPSLPTNMSGISNLSNTIINNYLYILVGITILGLIIYISSRQTE